MKRIWISLFLALSCNLGHARFPDKAEPELLFDFSYGLYTKASKHNYPPGSSRFLRNVLVDELANSLVTRGGFDVIGTTPTLANMPFLGYFTVPNGDSYFICSDNELVLATQDGQTWTLIRSGLNSSVNLRGKQIRDKFWFTNGSDPVFTWNSDTVTVLDGGTYGSLKTPNVPKGKYIEYDKDRVWIGNTPADDSQISYADIVTTDGVKIAPDDYRAWPGQNSFSIDRGNGEPLTFFRIYNGQLVTGKRNGVYAIFGNALTGFYAAKIVQDIGPISSEAVVLYDNALYFSAIDGFYEMLGNQVRRMTDDIAPDMELVRTDTYKVSQDVWDSQTDFNVGSFVYGSTSTQSGSLTLFSDFPLNLNADSFVSTTNAVGFSPAFDTFTAYGVMLPTASIGRDFIGHPPIQITLWGRRTAASDDHTFAVYLKNLRTNTTSYYTGSIPHDPQNVFTKFNVTNVKGIWDDNFFIGSDINLSSMTVKFEMSPIMVGSSYEVVFASAIGYSDLILRANTTAQYTSQATTISVITGWGNFDAEFQSNGGSVNFFIKTATSLVQLATAPYVPVSAGSIVGSSISHTYYSWASTLTAISSNTFPIVESVTVEHIEGLGSDTRSFGAIRSNRLWLGVSTETTGNFPIIYVKAKQSNSNRYAWTTFDFPVRSLIEINGILYGGGATSGSLFRLDYGTNDNGRAIHSRCETPDLTLGSNFTMKQLWEYLVDIEPQDGSTLRVGTSVEGTAYNYNTVTLSGTTRNLISIKNPNAGNRTYGKYFSFIFESNELDKPLTLNKFALIYRRTQIQ